LAPITDIADDECGGFLTVSLTALALAAPGVALGKGAPSSAMAYDTGGLLQADANQGDANQPATETSGQQAPAPQTPTGHADRHTGPDLWRQSL
jgi:hypothetical protein